MDDKIIVIDDDLDFLEILKGHLLNSGFQNIQTEDNSLTVAALFEQGEDFDIALIDMTMPEIDGLNLLEIIKNTSPRTECIMVTAVNEARIAVECLKKGAYDYLGKTGIPGRSYFFNEAGLGKKTTDGYFGYRKKPNPAPPEKC